MAQRLSIPPKTIGLALLASLVAIIVLTLWSLDREGDASLGTAAPGGDLEAADDAQDAAEE